MSEITRRSLLKSAAVGAASISTLGLLAACANEQPQAQAENEDAKTGEGSTYVADVLDPADIPDASTASNFNIVPNSTTAVGTTYENLLTAITGETGATTKYEAYAKVAEQEGFSQIEPDTERPEPPAVEEHESDINLISGANGEIYETSDMYPSFIKKAQEEGNDKAVQVFTRAKLAEAYHAKLYMDAYTTIDAPFDGSYYLCPICGYIHKGENFVACPICLAPKSSFKAY